MDWFRKNPFLGILAAATAVSILAAGYFLWNALGRYQAEALTYEEQTLAVQRLQENKPFPNAENVDRTRAELEQAQATLAGVGQGLELEAPAATPQEFQDQLREKVNDIISRAAAQGVELGEEFYLGFEAYETQPPSAAAAGPLALQLQSIHAVASVLVDAKVRQIAGIRRQPLAAEAPRSNGNEEDKDSRRKPGDAPSGELPDLMLAPFDVRFSADPAAFRMAFNRILETTPPVFVRLVGVTNSASSAPSKTAEGEPEAAGSDAIKPVLGQEFAIVDLRLASVDAEGEKQE